MESRKGGPAPAIEAAGLTRLFRVGGQEVRALDGVSFAVAEGGFAAMVGPSGSGKSTLLALLGGLDTPDSGAVRVFGQDLAGLDAAQLAAYRRQTVGFVFQDFFLLGHLTARENVELPLVLAGVAPRPRRARAGELLEAVGLAARAGHKPSQLSGGERQRVAIARALANRPRLILADEPTGNLDRAAGEAVANLLQELNRSQGLTLLVVTHNTELAARAGARFRLAGGRLAGPREEAAR